MRDFAADFGGSYRTVELFKVGDAEVDITSHGLDKIVRWVVQPRQQGGSDASFTKLQGLGIVGNREATASGRF